MALVKLPEPWVIEALRGVELELAASTAPFERPGVLEWRITGMVLLDPENVADVVHAPTVTALHPDPEFVEVSAFEMNGLTVDIMKTNIHDALDEHSKEAAQMSVLFDAAGEFAPVLEERFGDQIGAYSFVWIDQAWLTPPLRDERRVSPHQQRGR